MSAEKQRLESQAEEIRQALEGLDKVEKKIQQPDHYLLGIDATASGGRGQAIIAHGNPDTAQNVMTTVPGTYSDLGDVVDYVNSSDRVMQRAHAMAPGQSFASITYAGYESPPTLIDASFEKYAEQGSKGLSQFQEGLRASHQLDQPSNNTVIGHSYGSTEVGYAARDHGLHANNIVFIGSPGVGVDHASELGVPPDHVWSGTSGMDIIDYATPSPNPADYGPGDSNEPPMPWDGPSNPGGDHDDHWFGMNPSDPGFGGRELPTNAWGWHGDYWSYDESLNGMARVVANQGQQPAPNNQG
ncbi:hypothetical protein HUO13_02020 [Saccharopolyspora erythraea]|nr:hypothetical protein HUO13_02020 [Saccharopolyspora erythraea]